MWFDTYQQTAQASPDTVAPSRSEEPMTMYYNHFIAVSVYAENESEEDHIRIKGIAHVYTV